jgi:arylsulfatase A-like enzyme
MKRRDFLAALTASTLACGNKDRRPNVMCVVVDDMNDWTQGLGGYSGTVHTPHQEHLAARGVNFANAHCPAPWCAPSRAATFLGLRPSTTGVYNNGQWWKPALPDAVTMPAHFRGNGYRTVGAGKLLHHTAGFNPPDQWDDYFRMIFDDPWDKTVRRNYPFVKETRKPVDHPFNGIQPFSHEFDWGVVAKPEEAYGDVKAVNWGVRQLMQEHERPFFLGVGTFRPHIPLYVPKRYFDMYPLSEIELPEVPADDLDDIPPEGQTLAAARRADIDKTIKAGKWKQFVQAYLASITFADAQLGRLLDALDNSAYADNTIVVFWSDHGWHLGEKRHVHKATLWEEATRVPFLMAGPGIAQGTCNRPVNLLDIYPTLNELCGLPEKAELDGESLAPLLRDPGAERERPSLTTLTPGQHAVRSERWRYIRYSDGTEELYDHQSDPHEWTNLAADPRLAAVKREHARWIPESDAPPLPGKDAYDFDPETYVWRKK